MENIEEEEYKDFKNVLMDLSEKINPENYYKIKSIYESEDNLYRLPELNFVKNQICCCIIMGFHLAAFTLTNHLLEKSLKILLIYNDSKKEKTIEEEPFKLIKDITDSTPKFDDKNLRNNIEVAFQKNLIDEKQREILDFMRKNYRNALSHCDRKQMYGEKRIGVTEIVGKENVEKMLKGDWESFPKKEVELYNIPMADFVFIKELSGAKSVDYLIQLDEIINSVFKEMFSR